MSHFQRLSQQMAERADLLQKAIAQSQSVQEGLDNMLQSMAEIERNMGAEQPASLSSLSIQESLATNAVRWLLLCLGYSPTLSRKSRLYPQSLNCADLLTRSVL